MNNKPNTKDFVYVIVESQGEEEAFLAMSGPEGKGFVPVTEEKEQCQALLSRLPPAPDGLERQVEAINKKQILSQAGKEDYLVYVVDQTGKILGHLHP